MLARPWIAFLLLTNYLLVVGTGCMSRPEDQHEFVLVQTNADGRYQECRYLRMGGLEEFLNEALASRYQNAPDKALHHLISIVCGVDAHCLPNLVWPLTVPAYSLVASPLVSYQSPISSGMDQAVYTPPKFL